MSYEPARNRAKPSTMYDCGRVTVDEELGIDVVGLSEEFGVAIPRSVRGMLPLLPEALNKRRVVEIGCRQKGENRRAPNWWKCAGPALFR